MVLYMNFQLTIVKLKKEDILNIHQYVIVKKIYKIIFGVIKKILIRLSSAIVNTSNQRKCLSLNNQQCITQPTLINLYPKSRPTLQSICG